MSVRAKMFSAMGALALLVTVVYFGTTQGYMGGQFKEYQTKKWAEILEALYVQNGNTWAGTDWTRMAEDFDRDRIAIGRMALMDATGNVILAVGGSDRGQVGRHGLDRKLKVGENVVGTLYLQDWGTSDFLAFKHYILTKMQAEGFRVAVTIGFFALLAGFLLSYALTRPLRRMIPAIERVAQGQLDVQIPVTSKDEFGKVTMALNGMSRRLLHAEQARKRLVADVAHELRTPLAIMQAKLELIQQTGRDVPPENLLPIQDEILRLSRLVGDLQQLTLAESGAMQLNLQPLNLAVLVKQVVDSLRAAADNRRIEITIVHVKDTLPVKVDANRMTQVFHNLMNNAIAYTPDGGSVTITLTDGPMREGTEYIAVSIADSGIGIPEDRLEFLFDRFYRVEDTRSRQDGGMGLGLAIAKEFVIAHHGFVEVESQLGIGSVFTVYLEKSLTQV